MQLCQMLWKFALPYYMIEISECLNTFSYMKIHLDMSVTSWWRITTRNVSIKWIRSDDWRNGSVFTFGQKPESWAKVTVQCAHDNNNPLTSWSWEIYVAGFNGCPHQWKNIYVVLAGQATKTRVKRFYVSSVYYHFFSPQFFIRKNNPTC